MTTTEGYDARDIALLSTILAVGYLSHTGAYNAEAMVDEALDLIDEAEKRAKAINDSIAENEAAEEALARSQTEEALARPQTDLDADPVE